MRNNGDGTFVEVTAALDADPAAAAVLGDKGSGRSAGFFDYDGDGDLDLYLVNARGVNRLYRLDDGHFAERARAVGLADAGDGRGLALGDYDRDGDVDLFIANTDGASRLYRNEKTGFRDATPLLNAPFAEGEIAAIFGDYDRDGRVDLFVANEKGPNRLWRQEAAGGFREVRATDRFSLGGQVVGTSFFDYDNDGDLDIVTTAVRAAVGGDELYHNSGGDLLPVGALVQLEPSGSGRGLSAADYDGDGDVDLVVADTQHSRLYRNELSSGHWLQLDLQGPALNRHGLGAQVEWTIQDRRDYREVQSGYGYGSQVQPRVHLGLGRAGHLDTLKVRWPDGRETVQTRIGADQVLRIYHPQVPTAVAAAAARPTTFQLGANYPNPFNASTTIGFALPQPSAVDLTLYNLAGQQVIQLVDGPHLAGTYAVQWDGRNGAGRALASGLYLYRLQAGAQIQTRKLLLVR